MPTSSRPAIDLLKAQARPVRSRLVLGTGYAVLSAVLLVVQYRLLADAIAAVVMDGRTLAAVWPDLWPVPVIAIFRAGLFLAADNAARAASALVKHRIRTDLAAHLAALGPVRLGGERTGGLAALLVDGIEGLDSYYAQYLPAAAQATLVPLAILAAVLPADWLTGLILVLTAPFIPVFMVLIGKGAEVRNQRQWAKLARMSARFLEALQALTTLKLFNASRREIEIVGRLSEGYRQATMAVLRVAFLSGAALEFFATAGVALVAVAVGFRLLWGDIGFATGLFVLLAVPEFYLPLRNLGAQYHARMEAVAVAGRLADLLERPAPVASAVPAVADGSRDRAPAIAFHDVRLDYGEGRLGLDGADFELAAGEITALVGPSGAGKSSVVNLLLGFAPVTGGAVLVDGAPLAGMDMDAWRRHVAWVPQRPHLFRGTIADNIRLGDAGADDEAVMDAARRIGADAMIRGLPGGYDHPIGERGGGLSGGQARLVALARAALRPTGLLILDEPTASLDTATEQAISEALTRLARGRTVLIIAHRLASVRAADTIVVLDRGRVAERGTREALVRAGGLYAALAENGGAGLA